MVGSIFNVFIFLLLVGIALKLDLMWLRFKKTHKKPNK